MSNGSDNLVETRWPVAAQEVVYDLIAVGKDDDASLMRDLIKDSVFLQILLDYGVDKWDGYDAAVNEMVYEIGG